MSYSIVLTKLAEYHLEQFYKAGDKASMKKIDALIDELRENPYSGMGKPEKLKGSLSGLWSRRINQKDRLVYKVEEDIVTVTVVQAWGHYSDKG